MATTLSIALGCMGLGLALTLGPLIALFAAVLIGLSLVYSFLLKGTPLLGNALIGLMVGSIPFFGAISIGHVTIAVVVAGGLAFLLAMALEVLFTLLDERGDRQAELRTTAVRLGHWRTLAVFRGLATAVAVLAAGPWLLGMASSAYILAALACSMLPIAAVVTVLTVRSNEKTIRYCAKAMRVVSYASFLPLVLLHQ
jgi:4-hydroxybenzoate polyprenyltransferase